MMIIDTRLQFFRPSAAYREMALLFGIDQASDTTQSRLGKLAGIVPAMVNNYIKGFVKAGYVRRRARRGCRRCFAGI
jgi:DNA-binding MarR family transcriptional regulator